MMLITDGGKIMEIKIVEKLVPVKTQIYIADDGTEFDKENKCKLHEFMVYLKGLKEYSINIKWLDKIENFPYPSRFTPSEEDEYWRHHFGREFHYMIPLNIVGIKELNDLIKLHPKYWTDHDEITEANINKIICIEFTDDPFDMYDVCSMDSMFEDINSFYNKIGYEIITRSKNQSNIQNKPLNAERVEQIIYEFVAENYGQQEAYTPCYDLREMAYEIANSYNDKNYNPDFIPRYEWDEEK